MICEHVPLTFLRSRSLISVSLEQDHSGGAQVSCLSLVPSYNLGENRCAESCDGDYV